MKTQSYYHKANTFPCLRTEKTFLTGEKGAKNEVRKKSKWKNLAESVSESGTSNTSSNNNDINVTVWIERSTLTGGGCNVLRDGGSGSIGMVILWEKKIVEGEDGEDGAYDESKGIVGVHHFDETLCFATEMVVVRGVEFPRSLSLSLALSLLRWTQCEFKKVMCCFAWLNTTQRISRGSFF